MARVRTYNENARDRIRNAVEGWERRRTRQQPNRPRRHNQSRRLIACIADEDISHNAFGIVSIAEAASFDSVYLPTQQILAYNAQADITSGTKVLVDTASIRGADEVAGVQYVIVTVYDAQGSEGGGGTLDPIVLWDFFRDNSMFESDGTLTSHADLVFAGTPEDRTAYMRGSDTDNTYFKSHELSFEDTKAAGTFECKKAGEYLLYGTVFVTPISISGASPATDSAMMQMDVGGEQGVKILGRSEIAFFEESAPQNNVLGGRHEPVVFSAGETFGVTFKIQSGDDKVSYRVNNGQINIVPKQIEF